MRLAVWNMEWLNDLFTAGPDGTPRLKDGDRRVRGPHPPWQRENPTVEERLALLRAGLADLDAEAVVVVEGPNRTDELQLLFDTIADGTWSAVVQPSRYLSKPGGRRLGSSQCVGLAVRTDRGAFASDPFTVFDSEDPSSGRIHEATEPFYLDLEADGVPEWFRYERKPLYAELHPAAGPSFRVLGLHLKSKGIFEAYEWSRWWALADANRKRLLAQCRHLRQEFLDAYLGDEATRDTPLLVCGDINDGPGFDTSEMRLQASGVETLMGSVWVPHLALGNALFDTLSPEDQASLDFRDLSTTRFADPIFNDTHHRVWIDHVLYSRDPGGPWVSDAQIHRVTAEGLQYWKISDHFPISVRIQFVERHET